MIGTQPGSKFLKGLDQDLSTKQSNCLVCFAAFTAAVRHAYPSF